MNTPTSLDGPEKNDLPVPPAFRKRPALQLIGVWIGCALLAVSSAVVAQTVPLGAAGDFAVLGGSTVTNTGPTIITGQLGVSPGLAITGFPPGLVNGGTSHSNDALAAQAHADAATAFSLLGLEVATVNLTGQNLGGLTLTPGVYRFNTNAQLTGTLSLNTGGDPNAVFHFQIGSDLTTASNSSVLVLNGGSDNIFWQIGTSATLGTNSLFTGTIIADQSITLTTGATLDGRALAINAAVTLDSNSVGVAVLPLGVGRFWTGAAGALWSGVNWSPDAVGAGSSTLAPNADVVFSATGAQNQSTVLDADATISSLTVNDPAAVTISGPGLLSITGAGASTGLTINSGAGLTTINSDLALSGPAQVVSVHNAAGLVINGVVSGANGLLKAGAGDLVLTGVNAYTGDTAILQGTLAVDGSVVGNTLVAGGTLRGLGTVGGSVFNQALVQPGGATSPGRLTLGGNFQQSPAGTLGIRLAAPTSSDLLSIGGAAFLSGALNVTYLDGFTARPGDEFTILTAAGGVSGEFTSFIDAQATGTLLGLQVVYEDFAVLLRFTQGSFAALAPIYNFTPNQLAVARALDRLAIDEPGNALIQALNGLQLAQIQGALGLLSPEDFAAIFQSGLAISQVQVGNLERRLEEVRQGGSGFSDSGFAVTDARGTQHYDGKSALTLDGKSSVGMDGKGGKQIVETPLERAHRWGFFIAGTGTWGDLESTGSARGADFTTGGVTIGADYRVNRHFVIGAAVGYAHTASELSGDGDFEVNSGKGSLYATLYGGGFYLNGVVGGGYGSIDTKRRTFGGYARGQTDATDFNALLGTGYDIRHGAFTWGPVASLQYTTVGIDGFTERGTPGALRIGAQSQDSLQSAVGLKAAYSRRLGGVVLTPGIRAQWQHEYLENASSIDAGFSSRNSFTVRGPEIGRDALLLDAGIAVQLNPQVAIFAYYTGALGRENYTVHSVTGGLRVSF